MVPIGYSFIHGVHMKFKPSLNESVTPPGHPAPQSVGAPLCDRANRHVASRLTPEAS